MTDLSTLEADLSGQIAAARDVAGLEAVRVAALGKTGQVSLLLKSLGGMSPDERREQGPLINGLRAPLTSPITERRAPLDAEALEAQLAAERVDLTLPAPPRRKGSV